MKKLISLFSLLLLNQFATGSELTLDGQAERLHQYAGSWVSTVSSDTSEVAETPAIRMFNVSQSEDRSMHVTVQMLRDGKYETILVEQISHDSQSDLIVALGQNAEGLCFVGKGNFESESRWNMRDVDLLGNDYMSVEFDFKSPTEVLLEGFNPEGESIWKTRYVKENPTDKNIGIQLVSVHKEMLTDPIATLHQLGRMGYSYIETFVYRDRSFYGMSPEAFKKVSADAGLAFLGSMTFHDLPSANEWEASMQWWEKCIEDHLKAGVEYLTTSNNQLKSITSKAELQRYCEYYDAIGKLCKERGLVFAFHNHANEFAMVEDVRIYDYFLENTDPEYVFFQADIYWMDVGGVDPVDYSKRFPDRFISWHVKDYKELGRSGKIDWMTLFSNSEFPVPQYYVAEVEDYSYPPLYSVQLAWEYLYYELLK